MVLFDDGTLQLFDRPDCEPADVSMEDDDDDDDEDEEDEEEENKYFMRSPQSLHEFFLLSQERTLGPLRVGV